MIKIPKFGKKPKPAAELEIIEEKTPTVATVTRARLLVIPELEPEPEETEIEPEPEIETLAEDEEWVDPDNEDRLTTFQQAKLLDDKFRPPRKKAKKTEEKEEIQTESISRPPIFQIILIISLIISAFINPWAFFALAAVLCITIAQPSISRLLKYIHQKQKERLEGRVKKLVVEEHMDSDKLLSMGDFLFKFGAMKKLENIIKTKLRQGIFEAGVMEDSSKLARYGIITAFLAFLVLMPLGIIFAITLHPGFALLTGMPAVLLATGILKLKMDKQQRKSAIDHELPIFIACVTIMEQVGVSLYKFMDKIAYTQSTLFPVIKKDIRLFHRNKQLIGMDDMSALTAVAKSHPSKNFRDFVSNYNAATITSKTNTENMMQSATESAMREMTRHSTQYTKDAEGIAQIVLLVMSVMPLMGLATQFVSSGKDSTSMIVTLIMIIPVMSIMIIMMIDSKQPKTNDPIPTKYTWIFAGMGAAVIMLLIGLDLWIIMGISIGVGALVNSIQTKKSFVNVGKVDKKLPPFLQFVKDARVEGMAISTAVKKRAVLEESGPFRETLVYLNAHLTMGGKLSESVENAPNSSWLARIVFFLLGQVQESGGGSADTLRVFSDMIKNIETAKTEMLASLKGSLAMGYIIPVIMVIMLVASEQMTANLGDDLSELEGMAIQFPTPEVSAEMKQQSYFMVVECCIMIGFIVSKIAYFTLKHTRHVAILSFGGVAMVAAIPYVPAF